MIHEHAPAFVSQWLLSILSGFIIVIYVVVRTVLMYVPVESTYEYLRNLTSCDNNLLLLK
jgi:succinate dehydrogenase hydrophobic anchor subunit